MERCAIYTRISDDREGEERGVQRQEDDCRRIATTQGYEIYDVYSDNDVGASANTSRRKIRTAYQRLMEDAKAGKFSYVIAYSFSRLTRRPREFEEVVETFYKSVSTQLKGNDQKEFDLYLTGYLQGLKDFDVVQDRNLDGDAALIVCADALNKWRERYDK
ncbi:hypothetical protein CIK70_15725 [Brachybacterium alimentarium]|uniref:recombinase family protein n=1 Tax=Brachybacterium alimentarium TaxID=47845 RepID=UPI000DF191DC|nr:recombinase family protein [Brachybacterium alimentarium]RCS76577.1 hypothetical protein CIK70_15725 [Brachybacterium alimentarium]